MAWRSPLRIKCVPKCMVGGITVPCVRGRAEGEAQRVEPCVGILDINRSEVLQRREVINGGRGWDARVEGG